MSPTSLNNIGDMIDLVLEWGHSEQGIEDLLAYHARHGTPSLLVLTQLSSDVARETARLLASEIDGKDVIEVGAGVGFLALAMAERARSVIAIEADPAWSWIFTRCLYRNKPRNLTWVFGSAETMIGRIHGEVALIVARSGQKQMRCIGEALADRVIMPLDDPRFRQPINSMEDACLFNDLPPGPRHSAPDPGADSRG